MKTALDLLSLDVARSERATSALRKRNEEKAAIQARYDAAFFHNARSFLPSYVQGARQDVDSMSRTEILRRVRYFEKNSNTMLKALSILSVNVVGTGINPTPATQNDAWNKAALEWWNAWSKVADITGESTIPEMQEIVFRAQCVDGDHGLEMLENEFGRPAINLVESHRIGGEGINERSLREAGFEVCDGVVISPKTGKPLAYLVASDFGKGVSVIPASQFVLFYKKRRAGQYRGISDFHAAIVDLHDLDDLQRLEMKAAKDAASVSKVVTLAAGGGTPEGVIGGSLRQQAPASNAEAPEYYRKATSAETLVARPGDKVEQFKNDRPSAATSGYWDKLENKFVQGSGLSYAALCDYRGNWGGATLRAAVASDNRLFTLRTNEQARRWQRVWEFAIGWAMDHGELQRNPEFRKVRWHPPRRTTVDIGNESSARINELRTGLNTFETIHGEAGDDWRERLEQRAVEEGFINGLAAKYGLKRELISSFAQERVTLSTQEAAADDAEDATEVEGSTSPNKKPKANK